MAKSTKPKKNKSKKEDRIDSQGREIKELFSGLFVDYDADPIKKYKRLAFSSYPEGDILLCMLTVLDFKEPVSIADARNTVYRAVRSAVLNVVLERLGFGNWAVKSRPLDWLSYLPPSITVMGADSAGPYVFPVVMLELDERLDFSLFGSPTNELENAFLTLAELRLSLARTLSTSQKRYLFAHFPLNITNDNEETEEEDVEIVRLYSAASYTRTEWELLYRVGVYLKDFFIDLSKEHDMKTEFREFEALKKRLYGDKYKKLPNWYDCLPFDITVETDVSFDPAIFKGVDMNRIAESMQ